MLFLLLFSLFGSKIVEESCMLQFSSNFARSAAPRHVPLCHFLGKYASRRPALALLRRGEASACQCSTSSSSGRAAALALPFPPLSQPRISPTLSSSPALPAPLLRSSFASHLVTGVSPLDALLGEFVTLIKRTFQPSLLRRKRKHGFLKRLKHRCAPKHDRDFAIFLRRFLARR